MIVAALLLLQDQVKALPVETEADRKPTVSTGGNCLIKGGKVFPVTGPVMEGADILVRNGKIVQVGKGLSAPAGTKVIDAAGLCVTPGLVDAHSHRGQAETNEWSATAVPEVRIEDVLNSEQEGLFFALASGITTGLSLHGSSNAIGGESIVIKNRWKDNPVDLVFKGAPRMVKFALGENVSEKLDPNGVRFPKSRAGVESVYRRAFEAAKAYRQQWDDFEAGRATRPRKDLRLETLADILRGRVWVQCHSYRQDEMLMMVRLSQEYGFKIGAMQHALEAYKIAPELAQAHVPVSMFSDAWDYKVEVFEAIPMGVSICVRAGVLTSVNTDTFGGSVPLNVDAAKTMRYGVSEVDALKLITINPAIQLGVDKWAGSLEVGKDADIALWTGHPLSVTSKCAMTLIDGEVRFQRRDAFKVDSVSVSSMTVRPTTLTSDLNEPASVGRVFALVGGTVYPVSGPAIAGGTVVVKDGRIAAVGQTVAIPAGAQRISVKGLNVYPGLIDGGSDLGISEVPSVPSMTDAGDNGPFQPDLRFSTAVYPDSAKLPIARNAGVTTAFVRPSGRGLIAGQGTVIDTFGSTIEEMAVVRDATLHVYYPEGVNPAFRAFMPPSVVEEQEKAVDTNREAIKEYFSTAKRYVTVRQSGGGSPDAKLEAMTPYVTGKRPVVVHANAEEAIRDSLKWAREEGLTMILAGGAECWKVLPEIKAAGIGVLYSAPVVSCPGENRPYGDFDPYDASLVAPSLLQKAGVRFGLQTGDSAQIMNLAWSAAYACGYGLSKVEALKALTLGPAQVLGVADRVGSIEPGKEANLVVTDGDILEVTAQVKHVFVRGRPVTLKSKFTELYRKYEQRIVK